MQKLIKNWSHACLKKLKDKKPENATGRLLLFSVCLSTA